MKLHCRDEFDDSDAGSISLDEDDDDDDESAIFESDEEDDDDNVDFGEEDSDVEVSDPEEDEPKKKRMKPLSGKDFQKKLKNTNSMNKINLIFRLI